MMIVDGLQSLAQRLAVTFAVASMFIACCEAQTKQVHIKIDGAEKTCDVTPQFNGRMLQVTCDDVPQGMANVDKNGYVSIAGTNHNTPVEGKIVRLAATEYLHPTDGTAPPVAEPTPAETAAAAMSAQMEAARLTAAQRAQRTTGGGFGVGQGLDQLSNAVAGIVASREGAVAQNGTGFVVSVDRSTVTVLTARHLFYREGERERFEGNGTVTVTFFADRHQDYPAKLLEDSDSLDLAVLKVENVPPSISAKLPLIPVRPNSAPPSIADTGLRIFGGKEVGWQVANGAVSGGDKSAEGFQYMAPTAAGFSGSPVFDSKGLLLGVHLRTSDQSGIGRATRIDGNVYKVLNGSLGVTMNRLNFNVVPGDDAGQNTIEEMRARTAGFTEGFGRIDAHARKVGKWELTIWAWGRSVSSNYYDVRLEAILKGVGNGSQSVRVSDLRLAGQPHKYTAQVDELGKSAVVCFTGTPNMASPRPQRLTAWFSIDVNGSVATFSPSRPAALEPASENPCDPDPTAPVNGENGARSASCAGAGFAERSTASAQRTAG